MRVLEASTEPGAKAAIDLFVHRIGRELGALAAALGGLDAMVFTAGIGENSAMLRERVCRDAAWLGVELDVKANHAGAPRIGTAGSRVAVWVIPTNEELMIARHTQALLAGAQVSTAVKPIVLATLRPLATAHMLAPLPRCMITVFPWAARRSHADNAWVMYS